MISVSNARPRLVTSLAAPRSPKRAMKVAPHQSGSDNAKGWARRGDAGVSARCHPCESKGCTHESSREAIHLAHIIERVVAHGLRFELIRLVHMRAFDIHAFR